MFSKNHFYLLLLLFYLIILTIGSLPAITLPNNRRLFVISSGSMEPTLPVGSVVISKSQNEYRVGDVVTFINPDTGNDFKQTKTHRIEKIITRKESITYMTKGDANTLSDDRFISQEMVVGKIDSYVANLGFVINAIKSRLGFICIILVPGVLIVGKEMKTIIATIKLRKYQSKYSKNKQKHQSKR